MYTICSYLCHVLEAYKSLSMTITTTTSATSDVSLLIEAINLNRATTHTNNDNEDDAIVRLLTFRLWHFYL